jgi:hypothetical protein
MNQLESVNTEVLLEEILNSTKALKEATVTQRQILDSVTLNQLDRVLTHKNLLIEKIRSLCKELKHRGLDFADPKGVLDYKNGDLNSQGSNCVNTSHQNNNASVILSDDRNGGSGGNGNWNPKVNSMKKMVERTIREILTLEADSQRKLLSLKQHVRGILLDIQNRRKMLRGYAIPTGRDRFARILDTKM